MQTLQSEKKATKYLKEKDKDNVPQIQRELDTMIKQEFPANSPLNNVVQLVTLMMQAKIDWVPSEDTTLAWIEEERDDLRNIMPPDLYNLILPNSIYGTKKDRNNRSSRPQNQNPVDL